MRSLLLTATLLVGTILPAQARKLTVEMTAYCLGPCKPCGTRGQTRTGTRTSRGMAVDPGCIRLGRKVRVLTGKGYSRRWIKADDTGGAIRCNHKKHRMDYRTSHRKAVQLGRQTVKVEVR